MALGLSEEQGARLIRAMRDLRRQIEAEAVLLTDIGGYLVADTTELGDKRVQTMAALGAGTFSATREMAGLIGESRFRSVFHQGQKNSIYIHSVAAYYLVMVVFGRGTTPGLVKLYVERAGRELAALLGEIEGQTSALACAAGAAFEVDAEQPVFRTTD